MPERGTPRGVLAGWAVGGADRVRVRPEHEREGSFVGRVTRDRSLYFAAAQVQRTRYHGARCVRTRYNIGE